MTTAELIVRALDHVSPCTPPCSPDDDHLVILYAGRIRKRYSELKRGNDFTTAAFKARVEVINEILQGASSVGRASGSEPEGERFETSAPCQS